MGEGAKLQRLPIGGEASIKAPRKYASLAAMDAGRIVAT